MSYPTRFSLALAAATFIVMAFIAATPRVLRNIHAAAIVVPEPRPIQLDLRDLEPLPPLQQEKPEPPKRLIDAGAAAEAPVRDTDLISSENTQAQDMSDAQGDEARPAADQVDDFDQLGASATPPAPQPTPEQPAAQPAPETPPAETAEKQPSQTEPVPPAEKTPSPAPQTDATGVPTADQPAKQPPAPDAKPVDAKAEMAQAKAPPQEKPKQEEPKSETKPAERFQVAAAQPQEAQPPTPPQQRQVQTQELRASKGREGGGATNSGFTSFEANKHELGAYMLKVRNAVEREWRTALHLRYSGVSRTDATIKCSIRPDGTIEFVEIVDAGSSLTYAVLCREAIEKAGPFEPFPFDVPEIYRNENLEINWKFSYM